MATMAFDANYYLAQYQDVREAVAAGKITAEQHWKLYGCKEERNPNSEFNTAYYASHNTDVVASGMNYLDHYLKYGSAEAVAGKRLPNSSWESIDLTKFDKAAYLAANQDVKASGMDALQHYMLYGRFEASRDGTAKLTDGSVITPPNPVGQTYTLTTGADNIQGTDGNDIIGGVNSAAGSQFTAVDTINGHGGFNKLLIESNANYAGGANISNIQEIDATFSGGGNFNTVGITGLTALVNNAGTIATTFQNVASLASLGAKNTAVSSTIQYTDAAVAGTADAMSVTLDNVTAAAAININSVTLGGAGIETVNIATANGASSITLASNDTTVTKVTGSGGAALTAILGANISTSATTLDFSAMTGGVTLSGFGAANHTVTGGSGNDSFNFDLEFNSSDTVNGGAGNNVLAWTTAAAHRGLTAAEWSHVSNIQTVSFTDGNGGVGDDTAQDASLLTGATTMRVNTSANLTDDFVFTNVLSTQNTFEVRGAGQTAESLTVTLKDATGLSDTLNLKLGATTETAAAGVTLSTLNDVAGLETLNLVSQAAGNVTTNTITTDNSTAKHVITGAANLTIGNVVGAAQVDASALTGNLTIGTGTAYAVASGNIQSGSGNDTIIAAAGAQTLNGGAGNDTLMGGTGIDTLTGGSGADLFRIGGTALGGTSVGIANVDKITDFVAGTDKINFLTTGNGLAGDILKGVTFTTNTAAMAAPLAALTNGTSVADMAAVYTQLAAALPTAAEFAGSLGTATVARVVTFTSGAAAGTYLVVNDSTAGFLAADDMVINITGLSGTIDASSFSFA